MYQLPIENTVLVNFASFFDVPQANLPTTLSRLDFNLELATQLNPSWIFPNTKNPDSGLFMGCPLSNDRRELTNRCLFWCPQGLPEGRTTSLCSSRLGKRLLYDPQIANALRNFFIGLDNNSVVLTAKGVTLDLPLTRGCQLFHTKHLHLAPFPHPVTADWIQESLKPKTKNATLVWFDSSKTSADEIIFSLSEEVRTLHIRKNGTIERLVKRFRDLPQGPTIWNLQELSPASTAPNPSPTDPHVVTWHLYSRHPTSDRSKRPENQTNLLSLGDWNKDFLNHWTRCDRHPSPDENPLSQFDTLFLQASPLVGPLEKLCRILAQQKLLASGRLIPRGQRVVCFTEVPLKDFLSRRSYRAHLSRWDFEPWGISIRKSVLQRRGAQKVRYLADATDDLLAQGDSVFQVRNTRSNSTDWSREREWRLEGDLDLRRLRPGDAVVFVPNHQAATILAPLCRWPITILDAKTVDYSKS